MRRYVIAVVILLAATLAAAQSSQEMPKVFLTAQSRGNNWTAGRDQSQEMAKDFIRDCPGVQVTGNKVGAGADYGVSLHHIEIGFGRDNQFAVVDSFGNVLKAAEGGSIRNGIKDACALILADWSDRAATRKKIIGRINAGFQKQDVMGYAEVSGNNLVVHSERASAMRFHMMLANPREVSMLKRGGIVTFIYTNDEDQNLSYDVGSGQFAPSDDAKAASVNTTKPAEAAPEGAPAYPKVLTLTDPPPPAAR